jgi:hypothetical protein
MKIINRFFVLAFIALTAVISLQSCQKYPDGPMFSMRSRAERVSNEWQVDNYSINGTDFTSLVSNYTEIFTKDGDYSYSWGLLDGSGTWKFQNNDEEIQLTGTDNQSDRKLVILKLEEDAFWYYYIAGNDKYEIHLVSKD